MSMAKHLLQAAAIVLLAFFVGQMIPQKENPNEEEKPKEEQQADLIDYNTLKRLILARETTIIIDARGKTDFDEGHIPTAVSLPANTPQTTIERIVTKISDPSRLIITYCSDTLCKDSEKLSAKLKSAGHNNIKTYKEGWEEWEISESSQ